MKKDFAIFITTLQYMLIFSWCTKKVSGGATEIVDVKKKENKGILWRSSTLINNYFGSHY